MENGHFSGNAREIFIATNVGTLFHDEKKRSKEAAYLALLFNKARTASCGGIWPV